MSSNFTYNLGGCIYLVQCNLSLIETILFGNNSADKGAALYIDQRTNVSISDRSTIKFLNNYASQGGAIFIDLSIICVQKSASCI